MNPGDLKEWRYDEMKSSGIDYTAESKVGSYDSKMEKVRNIKEESGKILTMLGALDKRLVIMDMGCGTGRFAVDAARYCSKVLAVDVSKEMLVFTRSRALEEGAENVEFHHGGFLTYEHSGEPLDAIVSQLALHHLPDFWKLVALKRLNGMLKDGGMLFLEDMVYSFDIKDFEERIGKLVSVMSGLGAAMAEDVKKSVSSEFVTMDWMMETMLEKAGFKIEESHYKEGFLGFYLCRKA